MTSVSDSQCSVLVLSVNDNDLASGLKSVNSVDISEMSPGEIDDCIESYPIVTTGQILHNVVEDRGEFLNRIVSRGGFLLVLPPIYNLDAELREELNIGSSGTLLKSDRATAVTVYRSLREACSDDEFQVACSHHIRSSGTTILGRNENGQPVIIERRPTSSSGSVVVTTAELQHQSLQTREKDRNQLLDGLFAIANERLSSRSSEEPTTEEVSTQETELDTFVVDRVLIALATMSHGHRQLRQESVNDMLPTHLEVELAPEVWEALREKLRTDGILSSDNVVDDKTLHQSIAARDLESFVRRLQNDD